MTTQVAGLIVLVSSMVLAAAPAKAVVAPITPAKPGAWVIPAGEAPSATLQKLNQLYGDLEYESVLSGAEQMLKREDIAMGDRLEFWRLQGCAKAVAEDAIEAEKPFRLLLRARDDFELPANTPPKILAVFKKVQLEERALTSQLKAVARERTISQLKLLGEPPTESPGGKPLVFSFRLIDATQAVRSIRVPYRKQSQGDFSALALERSETGDWRGTIPGDATANEGGFKMQYYVETADAEGALLKLGTAVAPREVLITAGQVPKIRFAPVPKGVFYTGIVVTALLGATAAGLGYSFNATQEDYKNKGMINGQDGAKLALLGTQGKDLATGTNAALIATGSSALITVVLGLFTNFSEE